MKALESRYSREDLQKKFHADPVRGILQDRKTKRYILNNPNADGYLRVSLKEKEGKGYKSYYIHDIIYYMCGEGNLPEQLDHINQIKTDNRLRNLRPSTYNLQQVNSLQRRGKSIWRGVCFYPKKSSKQWRASLCHNRKHICCGYYDTEEEAARAYDAKARELWGEYADRILNFPL